jgi:hypothetical protein
LIPDIEKFLPVTIFKMATTIPHKFNIVQFQRPELIPDIEKFLPVSYGILNPLFENWTPMVFLTPPFLIKRYAVRSKYHV